MNWADELDDLEEMEKLGIDTVAMFSGFWQPHHKVMWSKGGLTEPENLMVLHTECHMHPEVFPILHCGMLLPSAWALARY